MKEELALYLDWLGSELSNGSVDVNIWLTLWGGSSQKLWLVTSKGSSSCGSWAACQGVSCICKGWRGVLLIVPLYTWFAEKVCDTQGQSQGLWFRMAAVMSREIHIFASLIWVRYSRENGICFMECFRIIRLKCLWKAWFHYFCLWID